MRLYHRTSVHPEQVLALADTTFEALGLERMESAPRRRTYRGSLGALLLTVRMEGGHYTLIEAHTDQIGESRLDKAVKRFFVAVHHVADPTHRLEAAY